MLVATAAIGVLVAHRGASDPPSTRYVVATREVPTGAVIGADDLGTVAAELPGDTNVVPESEADEIVGRVARAPISGMDLLRPQDVYEPGRFTTPSTVEVELDLPPAQALAGTVRQGDRVDVLSTDGEGVGTVAVARGAVVTLGPGDDASSGIGGLGTVRVRLALADDDAARAVVDAAVRTDVTLTLPAPGAGEGAAR